MKKIFPSLFLFFLTLNCIAQDYLVGSIAPELTENANAVIRLHEQNITISSRKSMTIITKSVVTILNEKGIANAEASEYFDKSSKIKSIEAVILDAYGKELKKIKRKDFLENSVSQGSIITDGKVLYLDYTPVQYPFTMIFQSEVETSNTAFIPTWNPIERPYQSVEKSTLKIISAPDLGFKYKDFNIHGNKNFLKEEKPNGVFIEATNLIALKNEDYSPSYRNFIPHVMFGLETFNLEGVEGTATSWKDFGAWVYTNLLAGTDEIPKETQTKIKALVGDEKDPVKIAKIVYQYVQNKTRYISIQLGIGGWKPMLAKDVDRLGYGDCKALTNYTRALLQVVGVPSYYTIIYGDSQKRDLHENFVSMQGNHVILGLPIHDKIHWLECTSQTNPFGFQGDFTDNRLALIVKPDGGEIVKTHEYLVTENTQTSKGNYSVDEKGNIFGALTIKSKGTQYDNKFMNETKSIDDLHKFYKNYFGHINNLKLKKINLSNNKDAVEFTEEIMVEASEYAVKSGERMIFALNAYNPVRGIPQRYRTRTNPFEISRGFYDYDEITIDFPQDFSIEAKPDNVEIKEKFGNYSAEYEVVDKNKIILKRTFQTNSGYYDKSDYESFRKFREQIAKNDNAKIVLVKN